MHLYRSDSLPSLHLTFSKGVFNEYHLRQGCVEFRTSHGEWRVLDEADVQTHFVLHTPVAKWLQRQKERTLNTGFVG